MGDMSKHAVDTSEMKSTSNDDGMDQDRSFVVDRWPDMDALAGLLDEPIKSAGSLPPLNPLRAFEATARHLSVSNAAVELFVTPGAVSRQVRALESHLGTLLFLRGSGKLELTPEGHRFWCDIHSAFAIISHGTARIRDAHASQALNILVSRCFLRQWLLPRLSCFEDAHPDILLKFTVARPSSHFVEDFDLAIKVGNGIWEGARAEELLPIVYTPICSPAYINAHGGAIDSSDLVNHRLICSHRDSHEWSRFLEHVGSPPPARFMEFSGDSLAAFDAAMAGVGIALGRQCLIETELSRGALITPISATMDSKRSYYLLWNRDRRRRAAAFKFSAWLGDQVQMRSGHRSRVGQSTPASAP
ncbi:LysR family glycine cleavage system transcriptional activator [Aminobacter niigataensis]|uniref:LysR family glycine cleavage system transcriptional activator n=2 Tax=Aminobacter niigataensis TaxID=83265 RepID=A0ABR6L3G6_9HYPH|nr:LysR family glycine cleavage system transcriptional activator [Aminobacter niigataensis]